MPRNEGSFDRSMRVVFGAAILSQAFFGLVTPWAFFGLIPLATGLVGYCPLYSFLKINTCPPANQ